MRAGFPAHRFPEKHTLAMGISQDLRNVRLGNPKPFRPVSPATLCPVDDLLVFPGGTWLPRLNMVALSPSDSRQEGDPVVRRCDTY